MTHEYTILLGGLVATGRGAAAETALAWAGDTILAIGSDHAVRAISRGDSRFVELDGATVMPAGGRLEVGGPATFEILDGAHVQAVVRDGVVVEGCLSRPGTPPGSPPPSGRRPSGHSDRDG